MLHRRINPYRRRAKNGPRAGDIIAQARFFRAAREEWREPSNHRVRFIVANTGHALILV